jgi:hypothetical protein
MSQTGRIQSNYTIGGISFTATATRTAEGQVAPFVDTVPAGVAGAISATGADGLTVGHGILQGAIVDVHWTDPADGTHKVRRGLTVDTTAAAAITFDNAPVAEGDALPAEDTVVVIGVQVVAACLLDGDLIEMIGAMATQRASMDIRSAAASLLALKLVASEGWAWVSNQSVANPLAAGDITHLVLSNSSVVAMTLSVGLLYQSVS